MKEKKGERGFAEFVIGGRVADHRPGTVMPSDSPALAPRTTLVIQPGREYKQVPANFLAEPKDGKDQAQFNASPIFEGSRMYYRSPGYLYWIEGGDSGLQANDRLQ